MTVVSDCCIIIVLPLYTYTKCLQSRRHRRPRPRARGYEPSARCWAHELSVTCDLFTQEYIRVLLPYLICSAFNLGANFALCAPGALNLVCKMPLSVSLCHAHKVSLFHTLAHTLSHTHTHTHKETLSHALCLWVCISVSLCMCGCV